MPTFPFELLIEGDSSDNSVELLLCKAHLRVLPGRREVYDAVWNGRAVVAKVFSRGIGDARRLRKERDGLRRLRSSGVNAPKLLFCGKTQDGRLAVVTEKIVDSPTVLDVFDKLPTKAEQADLLVQVCRELADQHAKGVMQKDLHLGNFLLDGDKILVLDPAQIRFFPQDVTRSGSISQLALLSRYLPVDDTESISRLCREYFAARKWTLEKTDEEMFRKQAAMHTKLTLRRTLRKCLRTNRRQLRIRTGNCAAMLDRAFLGENEPSDIVERIDELMAGGQMLKNGNTCYLSRFIWNGIDVVAKCYKHKGLVYSSRHTIKRSRARHCWRHAHRLGVYELATPRPLAYIEQLKGLLVWKSYLLTEYVEGQNLYHFLRDENVGPEQRAASMRQILEMLDKMARCGITHGDVKPSNILITPNGPYLTDLDSMRVHKLNWTCRLRWAKDRVLISKLQKEFVPARYLTNEEA